MESVSLLDASILPAKLDFSPAVSCPQLHGSDVISTRCPAFALDSQVEIY